MSLPRQSSPSHSPTPSKSSLRRTSGTQNPSQRSLLPPPSPRFEDDATPVRYSPRSPPNQTLEYDSNEEEGLSNEEGPGTSFPSPNKPFKPFFTLVEDNLTSEHYHPSVYYIFADDDHEIVAEAALRSLEEDLLEPESQNEDNATILPPARPGVKEHYIVLDVHPFLQHHPMSQNEDSIPQPVQAFSVSASHSLSSEWQVFGSTITSAPTIGENANDEEDGLMLRIEGRGFVSLEEKGGAAYEEGEREGQETVEEMIERFQLRLGEVRRLIKSDGHAHGGVECEFETQD